VVLVLGREKKMGSRLGSRLMMEEKPCLLMLKTKDASLVLEMEII
jgi:hypothetical protein